jgi:hypothetical protein
VVFNLSISGLNSTEREGGREEEGERENEKPPLHISHLYLWFETLI